MMTPSYMMLLNIGLCRNFQGVVTLNVMQLLKMVHFVNIVIVWLYMLLMMVSIWVT
jgi:hypothetical protein